jgi:serine protease
MKRLLSSFSLTLALVSTVSAPISMVVTTTKNVHAAEDNGLYYNFGNQKISLAIRTDTIAVAMIKVRNPSAKSSISLLQQDFGPTTRGGAKSAAATQVQPLGNKYAVLTTINDGRGGEKLKQQVETKPYIESTLPVLKIAGKSSSLVLPNETIVKFKPGVSATERNAILANNSFSLKSAKELKFAPGFYLVRSETAKGLQVLAASNQLGKTPGVMSSIPNFIEIKSVPTRGKLLGQESQPKLQLTASNIPKELLTGLNVRALQWHIDSQQMLGKMNLTARTDVRAPEAWNRGKKGGGVIVAVIDNLIQWDHPALSNRIATVDCNAQKLMACAPGEKHGYDFSDDEDGDIDTRISKAELDTLRPELEDSYKSDKYLQDNYSDKIDDIKSQRPDFSNTKVLAIVREMLRDKSISSFHGTMATGMIAGNNSNGFQGIAPNVKILPVRAGTLGRSLSVVAILNSLGYAADRGADVINMSFGMDMPNELQSNLIADLQKQYPKLVFVAAAGNETTPASGYPAAEPDVLSVGAISVKGNRASYSNFGKKLDVVAPGGDPAVDGGVLTLSGIGVDGFWQNMRQPKADFAPFQDRQGYYIFTEGTSFASPAVAGVIALMKSADPQRKLTAKQYRQILIDTSSRENLRLTGEESTAFAAARTADQVPNVNPEQFFFGNGLVNAEKAVAAVEQMVR